MALSAPRESAHAPSMSTSSFDGVVYSNFYEADDDSIVPGAKRAHPNDEPPELPRKSALRASRLLDNMGLKLGGSMNTTVDPNQATPLDVYLSSEEDASSDADDFSDYGYDSSVEDSTSPTLQEVRSRSSHEDTARVVSVIYAGKPSIIDLSLLRRHSVSPNSTEMRTRSSTVSSTAQTPHDRPDTPASSVSSPVQSKKTGLLSDLLIKKRPPPFLSIDPYANGSTYSLEMPKQRQENAAEDDHTRPPKTPTQLLKGVTRTFSLVRKRSRPLLHARQPQPVQTNFTFLESGPSPLSASNPPALSAAPSEVDAEAHEPVASPSTPQTPVTYGDIMRAAKKNAIMMPPSPMAPTPVSPMSPQNVPGAGQGLKRGILSGLAARRRSIKLTGKVIG